MNSSLWRRMLSSHFRQASGGVDPRRSARRNGRGRSRPRLQFAVEPLEDRILPSTVTWINPNGGDWDTAANWQDQNGANRVPGLADDAVISMAGNIPVTHSQNVTDAVHSLTNSDAFNLANGTLNITNTLTSSGTFQLSGGTLGLATVTAGSTLTTTSGGGTINAVTLAGTLNAAAGGISVTGGLTMQSGSLLQIGGQVDFGFGGSQTVGGTGEIKFVGGGELQTFGNLTLGSGITVHGVNGLLNCVTGSLANQGTIKSDGGGGISINGNPGTSATNAAGGTLYLGFVNSFGFQWSNAGQIQVTNSSSTLNLGGNFTTAGLGSYTNNGGTINLIGTLNNTGATLALSAATGSWNLVGGTLRGGTWPLRMAPSC